MVAIKSVANAVFAITVVGLLGLVRSRSQLSLTNCATLLPHLEMTMTAIKTGAVALP